MTIRAEPIASGASAAASGLFTVMPTVKTRKNVPMNSTTALAIETGIIHASKTRVREFESVWRIPSRCLPWAGR